MDFLADESCDFSVVRALRSAGHDVIAIAEVSPREEDDDVRERAVGGNRILITEDKDFGQLVYANMRRTGGVIFIRFPARARRNLADTVVEVVRQRGERLIGSFNKELLGLTFISSILPKERLRAKNLLGRFDCR